MSDKKGRGSKRSDRPGPAIAAGLKEKRDAFLHTFFKRGAELSDELVQDNRRLREQLAKLEADNAALKTQLASDRAIRDLLAKIDDLEHEKVRLLSTVQEKEEITGRITNRFSEIESELESFANLYVASFQLHLTLGVRPVIRHVRELLGQLVGARTLALYFADATGGRLEPVVSEGIDLAALRTITLHESAPSDPVAAAIEQAFLTGIPRVGDGTSPPRPAACVPLMLDERSVGVIVVFDLLEQKRGFVTVDRELFKLLGAHAAGAVVGAFHFTRSGERIPTAEELRAITG